MTTYSSTKNPLSLGLALGVLGGAGTVVLGMMTGFGPPIMLGYAAVILASLVAVRAAGWTSFAARFWSTFVAFMVATLLISTLLILFIREEPYAGPVWFLFAVHAGMAGVGAILSAAVAYVADLGRAPQLTAAQASGARGGRVVA